MASSPSWQRRVAEALGPLERAVPIAPTVHEVVVRGRRLAAKLDPGALDEAEGLRALASVAGGPAVPEVVLAEEGLLVTTLVERGPRTAEAEVALGEALARLHAAPWREWGGGSSFVGRCRVDPSPATGAADFYARRLAALAGRCGLGAAVAPLLGRLGALVGDGPPSLVHGDLWWGNVLWGAGGRAVLVDPSAHGGHPEEDLAMLGLFGEVPDRLVSAYESVRPLAPGWEDRRPLFRLYPLLVHAVLFGGGYRVEAAATVGELLGRTRP